MQPRWIFRGAIAFVAIVAAATLVAMGWVVTGSPLVLAWQRMESPEIVRFVPKRATGFATIDADWRQFERLRQFSTPPSQRRRAHAQWRRALSPRGEGAISTWLRASNMEFERDLGSWLGAQSLVTELPPSSGKTPDYLAVMSTEDVHQSSRILNAWWQELYLQGQPPQNQTYKGVQIFQLPLQSRDKGEESRFQSVAAVGDRYVAFASSNTALQEAIDSWQTPELSLSRDPTYLAASARLQGNALGWGYANVARAGWRSPDPDGSESWPTASGAASGLGFSYRLTRDGPQVRTVVMVDGDAIASEYEAVEHVPDVLLTLFADEPRSLWLQLRRSISKTEDMSALTPALDRDLGRLGT
ncbi:MAG: DUF3352 domain-containing protein, partial [Cyanobacteria bacterium J06648_11]